MPADRVCPVVRVRPRSRAGETLLLFTLCLVTFAVTCMLQLEAAAEEDDTGWLDDTGLAQPLSPRQDTSDWGWANDTDFQLSSLLGLDL